MNNRTYISAAVEGDLPEIRNFARSVTKIEAASSLMRRKPSAAASECRPLWLNSVRDGCFLLLRNSQGQLLATGGLDLDRREIFHFLTLELNPSLSVASRLINAIERRAIQFGVDRVTIRASTIFARIFEAAGYRLWAPPDDGSMLLQRSLAKRKTRQLRKVEALIKQLGVLLDYGQRHRLALVEEAQVLQFIGPDIFDRDQFLQPDAAHHWQALTQAALMDGVIMQAVSAYRSIDYQFGLLERKLARGQAIEDILQVSAPPGFSEHHSGRAIDITQPGYTPLEEEFERSPAFNWLMERSGQFGFSMSFPRGNRHQVIYEPWHWAWNS